MQPSCQAKPLGLQSTSCFKTLIEAHDVMNELSYISNIPFYEISLYSAILNHKLTIHIHTIQVF